ncbi:MAG: transposase, partial [Planctomycetota bacterium]|nr:transposase [Planctomycetota bacterium]
KPSPTLAISDVLRVTKANSSKWFNETFKSHTPFAWQRGFGAFSVSGSNADDVRGYIRNQKKHHEKLSFKDEFRRLLIRHGIEFDERYLFEEEHFV